MNNGKDKMVTGRSCVELVFLDFRKANGDEAEITGNERGRDPRLCCISRRFQPCWRQIRDTRKRTIIYQGHTGHVTISGSGEQAIPQKGELIMCG